MGFSPPVMPNACRAWLRASKPSGRSKFFHAPSIRRKRDRAKVSTRPFAGLCASTNPVHVLGQQMEELAGEGLVVGLEDFAALQKPTTCAQRSGSKGFCACTLRPCPHAYLLAFLCKGRWFCSSCH